MKSIFENWKARCSGVGNILTSRPKAFTPEHKQEIKNLENERDNGINANGNKVKWTDTKNKKLSSLYEIRKGTDQLPTGAISYLDKEFNRIKYGRVRALSNKYLDKGNICEEDSLALLSEIDGFFYSKNKERFYGEFLEGEPDNNQGIIRDTKTNFDKESFDNAHLTSLYKWQIKSYCILDKKEKGELVYCLVNNPIHQILDEKTRLWYKMGSPDDDDINWISALSQIERNMIFDIEKFKEQYPNYDFASKKLDFTIHPILRVKKFEVNLEPGDKEFIESRVKMAREYLVNKDKAEQLKIKEYESNR